MQTAVRFAEDAADRERIFRLRSTIYNEELGRGHAVDGSGLMTDALDETARLLLAEQDGQAVGTMRLNWGGDGPFGPDDRTIYGLDALEAVVPAAQILVFSRFATKASHRGGDLAGQLIDAMVRFAVAHGVRVILCDCRPELVNTYLRLGMRVRGPVVTTPATGLLVPLVLLLDDPGHIEAAGSRVAPLLQGTAPDEQRRDAVLALLPAEPAVQTLERPDEAPRWTRIVDVLARTSPERFPIFHGLSVPDIARLTTRANVIGCSSGDVIVRQGSREEMVFVVLEGAVDVVRDSHVVTRLTPGSVFGEVAFLARVPRTADIVSVCDSRLICLRPSTLSALIGGDPDVAAPFLFNLARILAVRLAGGAAAPPGAEPAA